jgi:hypothetical protein
MDNGDLFPSGNVGWGVKLASPTMDTGYKFTWDKFAWGESWLPLAWITFTCSPGVNFPGERVGFPKHGYRLLVSLG